MTVAKADNGETKNSLPKGWRWVRLGDVCEFAYGSSLPETGRRYGGVPVYGSNGIVGYHDASVTQCPTLVIGRKGSIGEVNYSTVPCWPIDTTYYIDSSKTSCNLDWLFFLLKFIKLSTLNKASGVPGLNRDDAYNQLIPLTSLAEQQRIARILNEQMATVEKARAVAKVRLGAAKILPAAYLREVFESDELRKWPKKRIGEICTIRGGKRLPKGTGFALKITPFPYIRVVDFEKGRINQKDLKYLEESTHSQISHYIINRNDVYISIAGTIGIVGIIPDELDGANLTENAARLIIIGKDNLLRDYLAMFLQSPAGQDAIKQRTNAVGQPKLALERLETIEVPVPSIDRQHELVDIINDKMDESNRLIEALEQELETIIVLPTALLKQAFTGGL